MTVFVSLPGTDRVMVWGIWEVGCGVSRWLLTATEDGLVCHYQGGRGLGEICWLHSCMVP